MADAPVGELRQRLLVRDGLLQMRTQARNQCRAVQQWPIQISSALDALDTVIAELDEQVRTLEREIAQVLSPFPTPRRSSNSASGSSASAR